MIRLKCCAQIVALKIPRLKCFAQNAALKMTSADRNTAPESEREVFFEHEPVRIINREYE